jgi:hypothetical protein
MNAKGISVRNVATLLATASLGIMSLGAAACNDDAAGTASAPPATSSAPGVGSPSATPIPSASASASPQSTPSKKPTVTGNQVIMIDPDGKKYTRKWIIRNAMMMAGMNGRLPSNFCDRSYAEGVRGGGKFPAGKAAFMDACEEGVSLAG